MALGSLVLPLPLFTSHPSVPSNGIFEMLTANLALTGDWPLFLLTIHSSSKENTGAAQLCQDRHLWTPVSQGSTISCMLLPLCRFYTQQFLAHSIHGMPDTCTTSPVMLFCCSTSLPIPLCGSRATSTSQGWKQISSLLISALFLLPRGSRATAKPVGHIRGEFVLSTC